MGDWLTEAARGNYTGEPKKEVPEFKDDKDIMYFKCRVCGTNVRWEGDPEDFDEDDPNNLCGGSPRCCP